MNPILKIFENAKDDDGAIIAHYDPQEVSAAFVEWFDLWVNRSNFIDQEVIGDARLLLGNASFIL